jgi:hypothetical protein
VNAVVSKRFAKKQQMQWSHRGQIRISGGGHSRFGRLLSRARAVSASCLYLTPPKDADLDGLPRCRVPPLPVYVLTREWKDVGSNMILSQSLHRQTRAWISVGLEILQTSSSCHHALVPSYSDAPIDPWGNVTEEVQ